MFPLNENFRIHTIGARRQIEVANNVLTIPYIIISRVLPHLVILSSQLIVTIINYFVAKPDTDSSFNSVDLVGLNSEFRNLYRNPRRANGITFVSPDDDERRRSSDHLQSLNLLKIIRQS